MKSVDESAGSSSSCNASGNLSVVRAELMRDQMRPVVGSVMKPYVLVSEAVDRTSSEKPGSASDSERPNTGSSASQSKDDGESSSGGKVAKPGSRCFEYPGDSDGRLRFRWWRGAKVHCCVYHPNRPGTYRDVCRNYLFYCSPGCLQMGYHNITEDKFLTPPRPNVDDLNYYVGVYEKSLSDHLAGSSGGAGGGALVSSSGAANAVGSRVGCWTCVAESFKYTPTMDDRECVLAVEICPANLSDSRITLALDNYGSSNANGASQGATSGAGQNSSGANGNGSSTNSGNSNGGLSTSSTSFSYLSATSAVVICSPSYGPSALPAVGLLGPQGGSVGAAHAGLDDSPLMFAEESLNSEVEDKEAKAESAGKTGNPKSGSGRPAGASGAPGAAGAAAGAASGAASGAALTSALSGQAGSSPKAGSFSLLLQTLPTFDSSMYHPPLREMLSVYGALEHIQTGQAVKVLNWNILAPIYASDHLYDYCVPWALSWQYRRHLITKQITALDGDIVCLQEVQQDVYDADLEQEMQSHGFQSVFAPKTKQIFTTKYISEGVCVFFKSGRFRVVDKHILDFDQKILDAVPSYNKQQVNRLCRGNVSLLLLLEDTRHNNRPLVVATTHITADVELLDTKLWQTMTLLDVLSKWVSSHANSTYRGQVGLGGIPVILCGDFNSTPDSAVYELLTTGGVSIDVPDPYGVLPSRSQIGHGLMLRSVYKGVVGQEAAVTNHTVRFSGALDYLCYSTGTLRPLAVSNGFNYEELTRDVSLPSPGQPSDHILTVGVFAYATPAPGASGATTGMSSGLGGLSSGLGGLNSGLGGLSGLSSLGGMNNLGGIGSNLGLGTGMYGGAHGLGSGVHGLGSLQQHGLGSLQQHGLGSLQQHGLGSLQQHGLSSPPPTIGGLIASANALNASSVPPGGSSTGFPGGFPQGGLANLNLSSSGLNTATTGSTSLSGSGQWASVSAMLANASRQQ